MQGLFIFIALAGGAYFLLAKRRFDYFALAFFSALIYFMPGFMGTTSYHVEGVWSDTAIHPEVFGIMIAVMSSIWLAAFGASCLPAWSGPNWSIPATEWHARLMLLAAIAGLAGLLATAGSTVFDPDKAVVLGGLGRWHILFYTAATIGLSLAFNERRYLLALVFVALLGFDLFIGFRSAIAISIISVMVVLLSTQGRQRLIAANWKLISAMLLFGIFLLGYKMIAFAVKAGMWDLVWRQLQDPNTYIFMLTHSEPFLVQQTLNEVVLNRFETNADHIFSSLYQFVLFAPELGAEEVGFNSLFQPALFPDVEYGLASNIWAQMWSAGGWPLLMFFILIFNIVLAIGNATLSARSNVIRAGMAPVFCYWAFYIHRNELGYALNLEKRLLLLLIGVAVMGAIVRAAARRRASQQT